MDLMLTLSVSLIAGGRVIPWLLRRVAATKSRELFTLRIIARAAYLRERPPLIIAGASRPTTSSC